MKMKKTISLCIALVMIFSLSLSAMAATNENILEMSYIVYDKDGKVKECGVIPNSNARYSWSGITLENGETAVFKKKDGAPFTIAIGTRCKFELSLNKKCKIRAAFVRSNVDGVAKETVKTWNVTGKVASLEYTLDNHNGSYFYWKTTNLSSDAVTINQASFTF